MSSIYRDWSDLVFESLYKDVKQFRQKENYELNKMVKSNSRVFGLSSLVRPQFIETATIG